MALEFLRVEEIKDILRNTQTGYRGAEDELALKTNAEFLPNFKKLGILPDMSKYLYDEVDKTVIEIFCDIPGCKEAFHGVAAYNTHYNRVHRHLCRECKRSLPTAHLLDLHLCETHDCYFATLVENGRARYSCFVEECTEKFLTLPERKDHCIKMHKLPPDFRFGLLDGTTTKYKPPAKSKKAATDKMEVDDVERKISTKPFAFGHTKEKMFNAGSGKALGNMKQLQEALPEL